VGSVNAIAPRYPSLTFFSNLRDGRNNENKFNVALHELIACTSAEGSVLILSGLDTFLRALKRCAVTMEHDYSESLVFKNFSRKSHLQRLGRSSRSGMPAEY
jgi:hypothetical protein